MNLVSHGSANSVFVTIKKKLYIVFAYECIKPGGRGYVEEFILWKILD